MVAGLIPNKSRRGINQRIAAAVTARPSGKPAFHIISCHGGVGPFMAIRAQNAAAIGIVQQHKFTNKLMLIRSHALTELAEVGVAVAFSHVAQDLIVGPVLFDDINDVPARAPGTKNRSIDAS
jgi:hypothetical protein